MTINQLNVIQQKTNLHKVNDIMRYFTVLILFSDSKCIVTMDTRLQ